MKSSKKQMFYGHTGAVMTIMFHMTSLINFELDGLLKR